MLLQLFKKFPSTWAIFILYTVLLIGATYRYVFGTLWGVFFLSVAIWWLLPLVSYTHPYTAAELTLLISALPHDYKVAAISSTLTILGFLISFQTGSMQWKRQLNVQLRYQAATEIETFFHEALSLVTKIRIFSESVLTTVGKIQRGETTPQLTWNAQYLAGESIKFFQTRNRLSELSVEVHRLTSKYHAVLSPLWGALGTFDIAVQAFTRITQEMWFFFPVCDAKDPQLFRCLAHAKLDQCERFIATCGQEFGPISAATGEIRGQLLGPITDINLPTLLNLFSMKSKLAQFANEVRDPLSRERTQTQTDA